MRVSQLLHVMDKDADVVISDLNESITKMELYVGAVRGGEERQPDNPHARGSRACIRQHAACDRGKT